ncbi:GumC family protein [Winogradskyella aquimaris]|uniref:Polysaccharide biosynthesis tyrosine autokinase n=1 Tax=Winogradskyella aquimaris TaxID=864074 RepID=A0ABU5EP68_9FLAO|nr:polysaccharide biosynthesis tyrosine autokinase [Winogradskyella aquimaris]MDY2586666.1 polysaccharide biosynthesis tyrosine autokinase [Winogradskyella aquimaris]
MKTKTPTVDLKQTLELFLSYWKWILLCVIIAITLGFVHLRYADYEYKANATIKIRDEEQSQKLPSLDDVKANGLFSGGADKIKDEIRVIRSREIAENIIKKLDLNIRYYADGKIKEKEYYKDAPIKINFYGSDSIIDRIGRNLFIKIKSPTQYILFDEKEQSLFDDREDIEGKLYDFGEKVDTPYGGFYIVPNDGKYAPKVGTSIKIAIIPVRKLINSYSKNLTITTEKGSSVLGLELKETVAKRAVDYLDHLIKEYNNDVLKDKEEVVKITSDFITNRLQRVSKELEEVDYTAEELQKRNNLTALGAQADLNLQANKQLEQEIASTATNIQLISYLQEEIQTENKSSDMLPADVGIGDASTAQMIASHNELVAERDRILKNSTPKNPVVINLNDQINALKANLERSLSNMKQTSELTLNNLNKENSRIRGQLYAAPTKARQFRDIKRQQDIKESLYLYLLEKREESAIRLGMYTPNAKIIENAYSSNLPIAPKPAIIYLASLILGLMIPIGIIYLIDLLDSKIHTKNDLTNILDIPYLGDIPKTSKKQKLIKRVDYSPKAEAFRIVRSNIDFILRDLKHQQKRLFVTSTKAQEGKSHTSTNLASSISFSEKSVLLIEMDIRVPKILDYLDIKEKPNKGLSDYIADTSIKPQDVVIKHPENKFIDIIPSGTIPPNPSELLMSPRIAELFKYFEKKYDYIVADTSAVGLVSDTLLISEFADMFIYVVSVDNVDKRKLANIIQPLYDDHRLPRMTMLLNGVKQGKKGYGYGYGYGNNPNKKKKWFSFS